MKVVRPGRAIEPPDDPIWWAGTHTCTKCEALYEVSRTDLIKDANTYSVTFECPWCHHDTRVDDPSDSAILDGFTIGVVVLMIIAFLVWT